MPGTLLIALPPPRFLGLPTALTVSGPSGWPEGSSQKSEYDVEHDNVFFSRPVEVGHYRLCTEYTTGQDMNTPEKLNNSMIKYVAILLDESKRKDRF